MIQALDLQNCKTYSNLAENFHLTELSTACKHLQSQKFSGATSQVQTAEGKAPQHAAAAENTEESLVVVRMKGEIMCQQAGKWEKDITKSKLHAKCEGPSVCADRDRIIVSGGFDNSRTSLAVRFYSFPLRAVHGASCQIFLNLEMVMPRSS